MCIYTVIILYIYIQTLTSSPEDARKKGDVGNVVASKKSSRQLCLEKPMPWHPAKSEAGSLRNGHQSGVPGGAVSHQRVP